VYKIDSEYVGYSVLPKLYQVLSESEIVSPKLSCPDIPRVTVEIVSQLNTSITGRIQFHGLKVGKKHSFLSVTIWADAQAAASPTSVAWHHPNKWNYSLRNMNYIYDLVTVCEQRTFRCLPWVLYV
jgi:hypothetical protein